MAPHPAPRRDPGRGVIADFLAGLDPAALFRRGGLEPDPWQEELLRSEHQYVLLNTSRQAGKSTAVAALAVHTAKYKPESLVLISSPSDRQSKQLFRKVKRFAKIAFPVLKPVAENASTLELENGSRIVSVPGKGETIRSYSAVDLLLIDEAAFVPDEFISAVSPMLAVSNGRKIALSTPYGRRGWFYNHWADELLDVHRIKVSADDCPRIPREFLEHEQRTLGQEKFLQEYYCHFSSETTSVFNSQVIDRMFVEDDGVRLSPEFHW